MRARPTHASVSSIEIAIHRRAIHDGRRIEAGQRCGTGFGGANLSQATHSVGRRSAARVPYISALSRWVIPSSRPRRSAATAAARGDCSSCQVRCPINHFAGVIRLTLRATAAWYPNTTGMLAPSARNGTHIGTMVLPKPCVPPRAHDMITAIHVRVLSGTVRSQRAPRAQREAPAATAHRHHAAKEAVGRDLSRSTSSGLELA